MKNSYLFLLAATILNSCNNKEDVSIDAILATNDVAKITSKKIEIGAKQEALAKVLNQLNKKLDQLNKYKNTPLITTLNVQEVVFDHFVELQGSVRTRQNILVYPEMPGVLKKVFVKEGQKVTKGQILAMVDDGGLSQQMMVSKANEQLAKTTYERQKRLWDQKIGSEMQFLQAKTSYDSQKNITRQLKQQLEKFTIKAPFSGTIDEVFKEKGTVVAPGQGAEIFRVINLSEMFIESDVPESHVGRIVKNKRVEVHFPILGKTLTSSIRYVGNFINPSNRSFKIEVGVPNLDGKIKPNLTARIKLNDYTNLKAILIPQSIISENANGQQFIYTIKEKKENDVATAERVIIETGKTKGDLIEVTKNLSSGTEVIVEGARSITDGQIVKVILKN